MQEVVKEDIINVIKKTIDCIQNKTCYAIEGISNEVIHNASIFQDNYSTSVAVIIYGIAQIIEKTEEINDKILYELRKAYKALKEDKEKSFRGSLKRLTNIIENEDNRLKNYFKYVIDSAKVNKGTKIYDHGISIGRVADILGRSQWEIISYIGKTNIPDSYSTNDNMQKRLKFARRLFS
ncbi:MAG: hypothetical protein ACLFPQ_02895 [Candidatus Woesearchaeota archaeon]